MSLRTNELPEANLAQEGHEATDSPYDSAVIMHSSTEANRDHPGRYGSIGVEAEGTLSQGQAGRATQQHLGPCPADSRPLATEPARSFSTELSPSLPVPFLAPLPETSSNALPVYLQLCHWCRTEHTANPCQSAVHAGPTPTTCGLSFCSRCIAQMCPGLSHQEAARCCLHCRGLCPPDAMPPPGPSNPNSQAPSMLVPRITIKSEALSSGAIARIRAQVAGMDRNAKFNKLSNHLGVDGFARVKLVQPPNARPQGPPNQPLVPGMPQQLARAHSSGPTGGPSQWIGMTDGDSKPGRGPGQGPPRVQGQKSSQGQPMEWHGMPAAGLAGRNGPPPHMGARGGQRRSMGDNVAPQGHSNGQWMEGSGVGVVGRGVPRPGGGSNVGGPMQWAMDGNGPRPTMPGSRVNSGGMACKDEYPENEQQRGINGAGRRMAPTQQQNRPARSDSENNMPDPRRGCQLGNSNSGGGKGSGSAASMSMPGPGDACPDGGGGQGLVPGSMAMAELRARQRRSGSRNQTQPVLLHKVLMRRHIARSSQDGPGDMWNGEDDQGYDDDMDDDDMEADEDQDVHNPCDDIHSHSYDSGGMQQHQHQARCSTRPPSGMAAGPYTAHGNGCHSHGNGAGAATMWRRSMDASVPMPVPDQRSGGPQPSHSHNSSQNHSGHGGERQPRPMPADLVGMPAALRAALQPRQFFVLTEGRQESHRVLLSGADVRTLLVNESRLRHFIVPPTGDCMMVTPQGGLRYQLDEIEQQRCHRMLRKIVELHRILTDQERLYLQNMLRKYLQLDEQRRRHLQQQQQRQGGPAPRSSTQGPQLHAMLRAQCQEHRHTMAMYQQRLQQPQSQHPQASNTTSHANMRSGGGRGGGRAACGSMMEEQAGQPYNDWQGPGILGAADAAERANSGGLQDGVPGVVAPRPQQQPLVAWSVQPSPEAAVVLVHAPSLQHQDHWAVGGGAVGMDHDLPGDGTASQAERAVKPEPGDAADAGFHGMETENGHEPDFPEHPSHMDDDFLEPIHADHMFNEPNHEDNVFHDTLPMHGAAHADVDGGFHDHPADDPDRQRASDGFHGAMEVTEQLADEAFHDTLAASSHHAGAAFHEGGATGLEDDHHAAFPEALAEHADHDHDYDVYHADQGCPEFREMTGSGAAVKAAEPADSAAHEDDVAAAQRDSASHGGPEAPASAFPGGVPQHVAVMHMHTVTHTNSRPALLELHNKQQLAGWRAGNRLLPGLPTFPNTADWGEGKPPADTTAKPTDTLPCNDSLQRAAAQQQQRDWDRQNAPEPDPAAPPAPAPVNPHAHIHRHGKIRFLKATSATQPRHNAIHHGHSYTNEEDRAATADADDEGTDPEAQTQSGEGSAGGDNDMMDDGAEMRDGEDTGGAPVHHPHHHHHHAAAAAGPHVHVHPPHMHLDPQFSSTLDSLMALPAMMQPPPPEGGDEDVLAAVPQLHALDEGAAEALMPVQAQAPADLPHTLVSGGEESQHIWAAAAMLQLQAGGMGGAAPASAVGEEQQECSTAQVSGCERSYSCAIAAHHPDPSTLTAATAASALTSSGSSPTQLPPLNTAAHTQPDPAHTSPPLPPTASNLPPPLDPMPQLQQQQQHASDATTDHVLPHDPHAGAGGVGRDAASQDGQQLVAEAAAGPSGTSNALMQVHDTPLDAAPHPDQHPELISHTLHTPILSTSGTPTAARSGAPPSAHIPLPRMPSNLHLTALISNPIDPALCATPAASLLQRRPHDCMTTALEPGAETGDRLPLSTPLSSFHFMAATPLALSGLSPCPLAGLAADHHDLLAHDPGSVLSPAAVGCPPAQLTQHQDQDTDMHLQQGGE